METMNKIIVIRHLGRNPEMCYTPNGQGGAGALPSATHQNSDLRPRGRLIASAIIQVGQGVEQERACYSGRLGRPVQGREEILT